MILTRRHRAFTIALATFAGGLFLIFITRGELIGFSTEKPRVCADSPMYSSLSFDEMKRLYHYTMEQLMEERMQIYEGSIPLQCFGEDMETVIPAGAYALDVSRELSWLTNRTPLTYRDFEQLLSEMWRTYDCQLHALQNNSLALIRAMSDEGTESVLMPGIVLGGDIISDERVRARKTFERMMTLIRVSEENLPLHASLRCLQRGAVDLRNAFGLLSDTSQCLPSKLSQPETSILK